MTFTPNCSKFKNMLCQKTCLGLGPTPFEFEGDLVAKTPVTIVFCLSIFNLPTQQSSFSFPFFFSTYFSNQFEKSQIYDLCISGFHEKLFNQVQQHHTNRSASAELRMMPSRWRLSSRVLFSLVYIWNPKRCSALLASRAEVLPGSLHLKAHSSSSSLSSFTSSTQLYVVSSGFLYPEEEPVQKAKAKPVLEPPLTETRTYT